MKRFLAIGYFKGEKENGIRSVAMKATSRKEFEENLKANAFIAWAIISEKKMGEIKNANGLEIFEIAKKLTSDWHRWNDLTDYLEQCADIMEEKLEKAA